MEKQYYVYVLSNKRNGTLYVGVTSNLARRVFEHKNKFIEGFTYKYNIVLLIYFEVFNEVEEAIIRETS